MDVFGFLADGLVFLKWNLKHYSKALMGFSLKLDPDYPVVSKFFPSLVRDTVLEWRIYGLIPLLGIAVSRLPLIFVVPLLGFWCCRSIQRMKIFRSSLAFWERAAFESPNKFRVLQRYFGELCIETCEAWKYGAKRPGPILKGLETFEQCQAEAFRIQDRIIRLAKERQK